MYLGCKFATEALSAGTRMELKPWGIHVSTINPGFMSTEIANKGPDSACPEAQELYPYMGGARQTGAFLKHWVAMLDTAIIRGHSAPAACLVCCGCL